jgi:hypothetical protein
VVDERKKWRRHGLELSFFLFFALALAMAISFFLKNDVQTENLKSGDLESLIERNTLSVSAIRDEISLTKKISDSPVGTGESESIKIQVKLKALEARISALENSTDTLNGRVNDDAALQIAGTGGSFDNRIREELESRSIYMPNTFGETVFENDEGKPLGDNADTVSDVFYDIGDSIQLSSLDCKESVCKVSYSHVRDENNETASYDDPNSDIVDRLVEGFGGADLDISYARNADGDDVMYIQVQ